MEILLSTSKDLKLYTAKNQKEQEIAIGNGTAMSPMETVLAASAGCSTIDIVMILEKMRQEVKHIDVKVKGTRREDIPRIFTHIHMHYILTGDLKKEKVEKAISSSLEKYCSVSLMLAKAVEISSSFEIISE